jgi:hypothetical protein
MKKIRSGMFAGAFLLAVTFAFAFTHAPSKSVDDRRWFEFTGSALDDVDDPLNYQLYQETGMEEPTCSSGDARCAVFVIPSETDALIPDETALENVSGIDVKTKE